jgi:RNase H-like domain found in reverse transcriptase
MHIKDLDIIAGLIFKLTCSLLIQRGSTAWTSHGRFLNLMKQLVSEPVMAFPLTDREYALITDATTGTADTPRGLRAILTQVDQHRKFYALSFASRQLKDHKKNYSPFLLDAAAAVWGMDHFNKYIKGKKFILYMDHKPLEKLGHLHSQTMNRFQMALLEHDFIIQYKKGSNMPADYLSRLPAISDAPVIAAIPTWITQTATRGTLCKGYCHLERNWKMAASLDKTRYHPDPGTVQEIIQ